MKEIISCLKQKNGSNVIRFIQVGANDGLDALGELIEPDWIGVLIEPNPHVFPLLVKRYELYPNLKCEQVAIHDTFDNVKLYVPKRPRWSEVASIFRSGSTAKRSRNPLVKMKKSQIKKIGVSATTLDKIIEKYSLYNLDILVIDTEGADRLVLDSLTLDTCKPKYIQYEHYHLGERDRNALLQRLGPDYDISKAGRLNIIALQKGIF